MKVSKLKLLKPLQEEFDRIINEFWFESYHVGIALKREDLWSVKYRSWAAHSFLLQMIEWNAQSSISSNGKWMSTWIKKDLWEELHGIFAHFDAEDSWNALFKTMALFKRLTAETAQIFGFDSREEISNHIVGFIKRLSSRPSF